MPLGTPELGLGGVPELGGLQGLTGIPGGYRGLNPVNTIGRGAIDFSNFPGAGLPMGLSQNQIGTQAPLQPGAPLAPAGQFNQGQQPVFPPGRMGY